MKKVQIYTDGACSGNPGLGGWGAVLLYNGHQKEISGYCKDTTNNRMEIFAVIQGLKQLNQPCEVEIFSDSAYVCNAFLENWINGWVKNDWKTASKSNVKNDDLWKALIIELNKQHKYTFVKVKGHADNQYNNLCDKLATDQIKQCRSQI